MSKRKRDLPAATPTPSPARQPATPALTPEQVEAVLEQPEFQEIVLTAVREEQFAMSGPLPHPALLEAYELAHPGLAERIVRMAEQEGEHRRALENNAVGRTFDQGDRGQRFALAIALAGIVAAVILAWFGHPSAGAVIVISAIAPIAVAFITGRRQSQPKQRVETSSGKPPGGAPT